MRIFVVNLERSVDRRRNIEINLQKLNLDYEIFNAVDGHKLTKDELDLVKSEDVLQLPLAGNRKMKVLDKLSKGEVGCALSHLRIYQRILDLGEDKACIIEDDCILTPHFVEAINNVDKITEP